MTDCFYARWVTASLHRVVNTLPSNDHSAYGKPDYGNIDVKFSPTFFQVVDPELDLHYLGKLCADLSLDMFQCHQKEHGFVAYSFTVDAVEHPAWFDLSTIP